MKDELGFTYYESLPENTTRVNSIQEFLIVKKEKKQWARMYFKKMTEQEMMDVRDGIWIHYGDLIAEVKRRDQARIGSVGKQKEADKTIDYLKRNVGLEYLIKSGDRFYKFKLSEHTRFFGFEDEFGDHPGLLTYIKDNNLFRYLYPFEEEKLEKLKQEL